MRVRASTREEPPVPFPVNYRQVVLQCQQSVQAALADGMKLVEVSNVPASRCLADWHPGGHTFHRVKLDETHSLQLPYP